MIAFGNVPPLLNPLAAFAREPEETEPSPYDDQDAGPIVHLDEAEPRCPGTACQYAEDVGMAMHGIDPSRRGGCGNCGHYMAPRVWVGDQA